MNNIKEFLRANHLRQTDIVRYLGISRPYMSQLTSGSSRLSPEKLSKLLSNNEGWDVSMLTNDERPREEPEIMILREKVKFLEQMLDEKERLITVLMKRNNG